ncbi:alpha-E domain-containing protein [Afifella sp. JA880]|uniref:alpha-E domain-containing protein n=1 Tax=Afifella sp. JA880 TaxID=2975280 RepID=UPI0021BB090F|nr:alpha-E domain-containing protein [Afifella sp. JA880]MCT8266241.1 alpha-E domain-containing protein [Afifella sp. JA880]
MLSRVASSLFWMSRYIERAENISRLCEAGFRISLTPKVGGGHKEEWLSTLKSAGVLESYLSIHDEITGETAINFLLFDERNASSVKSCLTSARNNARIVRTKLTRDMWESLNDTWIALQAVSPQSMTNARLPDFLDWVRHRTAQFRGALLGTVLRDEGYYFSQLGAFTERADNTARIVDVKYYLLLPDHQAVGGAIDTYQWETILRAVSAQRSYRHIFHEDYRPWRVAEFLILRPEMPRSLRFCYDWLNVTIDGLIERRHPELSAAALIRSTHQLLKSSQMDDIFQAGLHEFLTDFIDRNNRVTGNLAVDYCFAQAA